MKLWGKWILKREIALGALEVCVNDTHTLTYFKANTCCPNLLEKFPSCASL